ncbi:MAG: nitroreductase family protein [Desulfatibacillaceae bacterium]
MAVEIRRIEEKCNECLLCVQDCASAVFRDVGGQPVVVAPDACNRCSHCLAVCPRGAVEHEALDAGQVRRAYKKDLDARAFREVVMTRRSIRHYKDRPVEDKVLEDILDLARYSPTASNTQQVEYLVVRDKELLRSVSRTIFGFGVRIWELTKTRPGRAVSAALDAAGSSVGRYLDRMEYYQSQTEDGRDYILHNAPCLIMVMAPAKAAFACDDCNIAATNVTNYAHALGLGTCYIGFLLLALRFSKKLRKDLGVPRGRKVFASLVLGYPAIRHKYTVSRKPPAVTWR